MLPFISGQILFFFCRETTGAHGVIVRRCPYIAAPSFIFLVCFQLIFFNKMTLVMVNIFYRLQLFHFIGFDISFFIYLFFCWLFGRVHSFGCPTSNKTEFIESATLTEEAFQENPIINWDAILYVNRPTELWIIELVLALISLAEALLLTYLGYKVSATNAHLIFHSFISQVVRIISQFL